MAPFRRAILAMLIVLAPWSPLEAAPIEVRLVEGTAHGLLLVRSVSGDIVGHGDFLHAVHAKAEPDPARDGSREQPAAGCWGYHPAGNALRAEAQARRDPSRVRHP